MIYAQKINTNDLIKICDNVITARGTIGMEFAIHGKFPHRFCNLFRSWNSLECNTKKLFQFISKIEPSPKMSNSKDCIKKFFILWNIINFTDYQN